jgi:GT2 family glycosyltransferase
MPDEPRIWFITTCMGRLSALKQSLPTFSRQPNSRVIVVDYACPDRSGDWVEANHPECQVVRVTGEKFFHLSRARNAGLEAVPAGGDWVGFVDADVCLSPSFCQEARPLLGPRRFAVVPMHPGNKGLTGLILASRQDIASCGGFDEEYENYGREASAMRVALFGIGLQPVYLSASVAHHLEHGDELRSRHYRERDLVRSNSDNSRRLRVLIEEVEARSGTPIPRALCYRDVEHGALWRALWPLRATYRRLARAWRSR